MLIKEYRITMPMTSVEYHIAQLYMVAKSSQEESGEQAGEGVEILRNEPFAANSDLNIHTMPAGQYTEKIFHLKSKLPKFIAKLVPESMTHVVERSWNSFPRVCTEYSNSYFGDKFAMSIKTMHADDRGTQHNAVGLSAEDLALRKVDTINIAADKSVSMEPGEDPTTFESKRTGRGKLALDFHDTCTPVMTCYKVVRLHFKVFGLQSTVESWGHTYGSRNTFLTYNRKIWCWIDEWFGLSITDIRTMEDETVRITKEKIAQSITKSKNSRAPAASVSSVTSSAAATTAV